MIEAWAAMQQDEGWPLDHGRVGRGEALTVDVEVKSEAAADIDPHVRLAPLL